MKAELVAQTMSTECPTCGAVEKSGKISCCGRGGAWFNTCGNVGNTQVRHTWREGIRACKARAQFKIAREQQSNPAQQLDPLNGTVTAHCTLVLTVGQTFTITSTNTSIALPNMMLLLSANALSNTPTNRIRQRMEGACNHQHSHHDDIHNSPNIDTHSFTTIITRTNTSIIRLVVA